MQNYHYKHYLSCIVSVEDLMNLEMAIQAGFICTPTEMKETPITEVNSVIRNIGNSKEKKHFLCKPEGYNPSSLITRCQLEQLRLYEGWCVFSHNEYMKNSLCVLEEMSRQIYGVSATIPNQCLEFFHWIIGKSSRSLHIEPNTNLHIYPTISKHV
jgi:hypothetical protein